jgi:excisionase family DNA binding protein
MTDIRVVGSLDELARDPARAAFLPQEERVVLLAQVASLLVALASTGAAGATGDRLLTVEEAAAKLACSRDTLYRNKRHPARVQNGRSVRFSEKALDTIIRRRLKAQG